MINNTQVIMDTLHKAIAAQDPTIIKSNLQIVINELNLYLNKLNNFYEQLEDRSSPVINKYRALHADETTVSYALFKQLSYNEKEIEELLKEGYILLDQMRTFFTGETITYTIGLPYRGTLYEKTMSMEEMLNYAHAEFGTKSKIDNLFKLRMTNKKGLRESLQADQSTIVSSMNGASSVWSTIWHYIHSDSVNSKNKNLGNAYEVYRVIVAKRGTNEIPPPGPDINEIESIFDSVRSNTASSQKGGDFMTEQIKYFASAPSLITTSLVRNTLNELLNIFNKYLATANSADFKEALSSLYLKDANKNEITDAIELEGIRISSETLNKVINNLNITMS